MLRLALKSDALQLAELRWLSREEHEQRAEPLEIFTPRFNSWLVTALGSGLWLGAVAPEGAELVGCMFLQRIATVPVPGGTLSRQWGYITHAYVRPPHRRQGLGTSMLELLIVQARQLKLHELHVWPSVAAVSLYTRAGFLSPEEVRATVPPDEPSYVLPIKQLGSNLSQDVA
jgi:ribosomal protein S18 acetylase RimI-like enzyme